MLALTKKAEECFNWLTQQFSDRPDAAPNLTVLVAATFQITAAAAQEYVEYWEQYARNYSRDIGRLHRMTQYYDCAGDPKWRKELWTLLPSLMAQAAAEALAERKDVVASQYVKRGEAKLIKLILHKTHRTDVCGSKCYPINTRSTRELTKKLNASTAPRTTPARQN